MKFLQTAALALTVLFLGPISKADPGSPYPLYFAPEDVPAKIDVTLLKTSQSSETLTLRLPANFSTGASWEIRDFKKGEVAISEEELPATSVEINQSFGGHVTPQLGRTQMEVITLPELSMGQHRYTLTYGRSWESTPWRVTELTIKVIQQK